MHVDELSKKVADFRDAREWRQFHKPKDLAVSISIESAEVLELFQWKTDAEIDRELKTPAGKKALAHELADVVMLCMGLSDAAGIDLGKAILEKLEINEKRYPADRARGSAKKYTHYTNNYTNKEEK